MDAWCSEGAFRPPDLILRGEPKMKVGILEFHCQDAGDADDAFGDLLRLDLVTGGLLLPEEFLTLVLGSESEASSNRSAEKRASHTDPTGDRERLPSVASCIYDNGCRAGHRSEATSMAGRPCLSLSPPYEPAIHAPSLQSFGSERCRLAGLSSQVSGNGVRHRLRSLDQLGRCFVTKTRGNALGLAFESSVMGLCENTNIFERLPSWKRPLLEQVFDTYPVANPGR